MVKYDIAQICLNGHVTNRGFNSMPNANKKYCQKCGEPTITACPHCYNPIRGAQINPWTGIANGLFSLSSFCEHCGQPFPWTLRRIEAAKELINELDLLDEIEKTQLANSIEDIVKNSPNTQIASVRFKRLVQKAGVGIASMFREILVDVLSEAAKKTLFPSA